jgi:hypothetical protein
MVLFFLYNEMRRDYAFSLGMEALMKLCILRLIFCSMSCIIFLIVTVHAEYFEGIDTTDSDGFGLDSSFGISPRTGLLNGNDLIGYSSVEINTNGYIDCSFDDLKLVPDTIREIGGCNINSTFILRDKKDSSYVKLKLLKKIEGVRYVYKYGKNTIPNNKMLIDSNYDRSVKYKPNNVYNRTSWIILGIECADSLYWEPPLQNNNHLIGYILYASKSKGGAGIDTAQPIDTTQWDSVAFYSSTAIKAKLDIGRVNGSYINMVAVYEEGKSDFLDGWTWLNVVTVNGTQPEHGIAPLQKKLSIYTVPGGVFISLPYLPSSEPFSVSLFNPNGSLHSRISGIKGNKVFLENDFSTGLYLLRAEFPGRSAITQPFTITR